VRFCRRPAVADLAVPLSVIGEQAGVEHRDVVSESGLTTPDGHGRLDDGAMSESSNHRQG